MRHRWPRYDRPGACQYEDRCTACGLLKRAPGPRPPCQPEQATYWRQV